MPENRKKQIRGHTLAFMNLLIHSFLSSSLYSANTAPSSSSFFSLLWNSSFSKKSFCYIHRATQQGCLLRGIPRQQLDQSADVLQRTGQEVSLKHRRFQISHDPSHFFPQPIKTNSIVIPESMRLCHLNTCSQKALNFTTGLIRCNLSVLNYTPRAEESWTVEMEIICVWDFFLLFRSLSMNVLVVWKRMDGIYKWACGRNRQRSTIADWADDSFTSFTCVQHKPTDVTLSFAVLLTGLKTDHLKAATGIIYLDDKLLSCCPWLVLTNDALRPGCLWFF